METYDADIYSHVGYGACATPFEIDNNLDSTNRILIEAEISPVKSQTIEPLEEQSKNSIRRLVSKLQRGTQILQSKCGKNGIFFLCNYFR